MKQTKLRRKLNPKGQDGEIMRCTICDSIRHLLGECPHSWENMSKKDKAYTVEEKESDKEWEESFFTSNYRTNLKEVQTDIEVEDVIL